MTMPANGMEAKRDIKWADGLRGIAGVLVVFHHLRVGFAPEYNSHPARDRYWFHLPFLRIVVTGGNFCVALFFLLSGFVCSLKTMRKARQGEAQEARTVAAESIIRRIVRLVVPAAAATTVSFVCSQMEWYKAAWDNGSPWLQRVKLPVEGFKPAVYSLFWNCVHTWTISQNDYDGNQWTLKSELQESMWLYLTLIATATFTPFWRLMALVFMLSLSLHQSDLFFANVSYFAGAILAELSFMIPSGGQLPGRMVFHKDRRLLRFLAPLLLAVLGCYLGSYPEENGDQMKWSKDMHDWGQYYFEGYNHQRLYSTMGGSFLILAILLSPHLRHILSHRYLVFLGGISYGLYLLHATLMRSLLATVIFSLPRRTEQRVVIVNEREEQLRIDTVITEVSQGWGVVRAMAFGGWFVGLIYLAHVWRRKVDGLSLVMAKWLEEVASGRKALLSRGQGEGVQAENQEGNGVVIEGMNGDVEMGILEKEVKD